jgi:hypothetical protein
VAQENVIRAALVLLAALGGGAQGASDCASALGAAPPWVAEADGVRVVFVAPRPLPVGRHFDVDFVVCGAALRSGATITLDADMPAHRHGMNYRARVEALPHGGYRAHGVMFHMPGTWRVMFDLPLEGRTLRVAREIEVQ